LPVRRLPRILLNVATALSLLLALATVALWVRSYSVYDQFGVQVGQLSPRVSTTPGGLALLVVTMSPEEAAASDRWWWSTDAIDSVSPWPGSTLGFKYENLQIATRTLRGVIIPGWFALLVMALLPAYRLARRMCRRPKLGHCRHCGYDLRATPERCPECGTEQSPKVPG
jgi:hypothetical protein